MTTTNDALFGYTGFVGKALTTMYKFNHLFNSVNIKDAKNQKFDNAFISCIPAVKWYSNKYPEEDYKLINDSKEVIKTIDAKNVILISTIDVYDNVSIGLNEDSYINCENNHTYGKNRYLFEKFIQDTFKSSYIIRLPALYGNGLKKNIIYDLLNNNEINKININSTFQWYNTEWLKYDIDNCIRNNIRCCNLFTAPIKTIDIVKMFDYDINKYTNGISNIYNTKTKYSEYFTDGVDGYIRSCDIVLEDIKRFVMNYHNKHKYDLCVSNIICGDEIKMEQLYNIMNYYSINNIEIAPTKYGNWDDILNNNNLSESIDRNINIYSLQSITYKISSNIFNNSEYNDIKRHLEKVIDFSIRNNVRVLVFGSPNNRKINPNIDLNDSDNIFINLMRELGDYISDNCLKICIENNSKKYNCNYLNTIKEVGEIINKINHKNIKQIVDVGNCIMENDDLNSMIDYQSSIYHIHISSPYMNDILYYNKNVIYNLINILDKINYNKKITLEIANINNVSIINDNIKKFKQMFT